MYIMPFLNLKYYTGNIIVLFALIFLFYSENYSQNNKTTLHKNNDLQDTTEIINLIKLAQSYLKCNSDSSVYLSNKALLLIKDTNNELYLKALDIKGKGFLYAGDCDSAFHFMNILHDLSIANNDKVHETKSLNNIAIVYLNKGNYKNAIDYMQQSYEKSKEYKLKDREAASLNNLGLIYKELGFYNKSLESMSKAYILYSELNDTLTIITIYNNLGLIHKDIKDYDEALKYYFKALALANIKNNIKKKSILYINLGVLYQLQEDYDTALNYFQKALKLQKIIKDEYGLAINYSDIAEVYINTEKYKSAIQYYLKAVEIYEIKGSLKDKISVHCDIAKAYILADQINNAKIHIRKVSEILDAGNNQNLHLSIESYEVLLLYYEKTKNYKESLKYSRLIKKINDSLYTSELNDKIAEQKILFDIDTKEYEIDKLQTENELNRIKSEKQKQRLKFNKYIFLGIFIIILIGLFFMFLILRQLRHKKRINSSLNKNRKAILEKNNEITQQNEEIKAQTDQLYEINEDLLRLKTAVDETDNAVVILDKHGNFEWGNKGFDNLYDIPFNEFIKIYPNIFDALKKSSNYKEILKVIKNCIKNKTSGSYEFSTFNPAGEKIWIQTSIKAITDLSGDIQNIIIIDTDISEKVKNNRLMIMKSYELEKQREEINASLRYAQNIQKAILPAPLNMRKNNDFFLIYLPKDIVSGDFYWFSDKKESPYTYFAVIDCTGHGVPGAFMSMIGARILNSVVNEKGITMPSKILEEMHISVKITLKQKITGNRDGMDISLCRIEKKGKGVKEIVFSGAKQTVFHYNSKKNILNKLRGDIKTIGGHYYDKVNFTDKKIKVSSNDVLYLFTDGYIDQDSPSGKKIGSVNLAEILSKIASLPLSEQKEYLLKTFNSHKKDVNQRDDITFLGIKIE